MESTDLINLYKGKEVFGGSSRSELSPFVPLNAKNYLDIGCGEGVFGESIKSLGDKNVWGIDINPASIERAKVRLDKAFCGDVSVVQTRLPDSFFDAIFFNDVLEHLVDPYKLLVDVTKKLSPGGVVIASIPNVLYYRVLKDLIFRKEWRYQEYGVLAYTHLRFFTKKSMIRMFEESGYEIIKVQPINKTKSWYPFFMNLFTLNLFGDQIKYINYVIVAKPRLNKGQV